MMDEPIRLIERLGNKEGDILLLLFINYLIISPSRPCSTYFVSE